MKKTALFVAGALALFACAKKAEEAAPVESITLPMEVTYKGTPAIGNMKNVQTVMEWNKRLGALNTELGDLLADTVSVHLSDGFEMTVPKDTLIVFLKDFVAGMTSVNIVYTAATPVDNTTTKDEWVFSWTDETYTHKDGKVEHTFIHEDYRMVEGKIREVFQYARKEAPPKPAAK
jgi:hypothetical protein